MAGRSEVAENPHSPLHSSEVRDFPRIFPVSYHDFALSEGYHARTQPKAKEIPVARIGRNKCYTRHFIRL